MNDYLDKVPAVEEEPDEYPPEYQDFMDMPEPLTPEDMKKIDEWLDELNKKVV